MKSNYELVKKELYAIFPSDKYQISIGDSAEQISLIKVTNNEESEKLVELEIYIGSTPKLTGYKGIIELNELIEILSKINNILDKR
ncbi:hypothetical protein [Labilibacter marinus]|uniref:hypothetical protein n=1 Tax=Labilibacter marinus TaxID=1477105 RepID=UPI00082CF4D8|nr:hypothetical protein [Labilibacter marinus]